MNAAKPIHPNLTAAASASSQAQAHGQGSPVRDKLRRSTEEFEAVLLRQVLTAAQKPLLAKPLFENSQAADIVRDMRTDRMAESISRTGSVGLARYLETHLRKNLSNQDADTVRTSLQS